ncbi:DNA topoisomerase IB [Pedobacter caeni]|uniref:DNA topoisomerase n=1 Tax=Pedobacter caeni TaxID=288992 RepID=A0A1M5HUY2_9SPHI|nr:DNA topoisomerase IB [Pedobacter caeni]SHG19748.1 DNA topoisomerase-1 [Pedobacter caeni]
MVETLEALKSTGLVYVTDSKPGIYRKGKPGQFRYEDKDGNTLKDKDDLDRIKKLVLPPAWTEVWISPKQNGYLQATGIDVAGRKQYRYHTEWTSRRSDSKYFRLLDFGKALPAARKRMTSDLRRKDFDERKVLAICIEFMQKTLIRIGNESYKQLYGSYGLSTLRNKHVKINGNHLVLSFVGKKGVQQELNLNDRSLSRLLRKCKDIPGQDLFQFYADGNERKPIDSGMINNYIKEITGGDFSAKDFRTWGGTLEALRQLAVCGTGADEEKSRKKIIIEVLDCVASRLGNTRAVCKSSYVYPLLLEAFEQGELTKYLKKINIEPADTLAGMKNDEKVLMSFLKNTRKKKKP